MKVAILLSSLSERKDYAPTVTSYNTSHEKVAACDYIKTILIDEIKWISGKSVDPSIKYPQKLV